MPRPRKPTQVLELTGRFKHDPQRKRDREGEPTENGPLGDPPSYMTVKEKALWKELAGYLVAGVALASDRPAFAHLVELEQLRRRRRITAAERAQLVRLQVAFGMTPADRSRVKAPSTGPKANPFSRVG